MRTICPGCNEPVDGQPIRHGELSHFGSMCSNCQGNEAIEDIMQRAHFEARDTEKEKVDEYEDFFKNICDPATSISVDFDDVAKVMCYSNFKIGYEIIAFKIDDGGKLKYRYLKEMLDDGGTVTSLLEFLERHLCRNDFRIDYCNDMEPKGFFDFFDEKDEKWEKINVSVGYWF